MKYLTAEDIISINVEVQNYYGTSPLIRDDVALDYIVQSADQVVFGKRLYDTSAKLGAYYVIKLTKKHIFNDANKRTAYLALNFFLAKNNLEFVGEHLTLANMIIKIAQVDGETDEMWERMNAYLEENIQTLS
ncbi:type II toxin-antitoxin system death-on-curing family toxin [Lactobacillus selangorensis]|nr:type II toxin-antitoxin system death-on-curing family toxin [Lactobacillus selangorensis]